MAYELKDMSGNVFVNANKSSEKHPSYKGAVKLLGKQYDLAIWVRRDRNDQTYWSFELSEPYRKPEDAPPRDNRPPSGDIPF